MRLFKVKSPEVFDDAREVAMDVHFASEPDESGSFFIVIGGRVAISFHEEPRKPIEGYLDQPWLRPSLSLGARETLFDEWLGYLPEAPLLEAKSPSEFIQPVMLNQQRREGTPILAFIVGPLNPLSSPPPRPASIYGHLPFGTMTAGDTVIYRWEAFPTSRRIDKSRGTIAPDTYAAPASELPFAPTGFSAVARFALPNLLPASFRWELQPVTGLIECGASVPLYGQSGGGVEVRFPSLTNNRCQIADPVFLPVM